MDVDEAGRAAWPETKDTDAAAMHPARASLLNNVSSAMNKVRLKPDTTTMRPAEAGHYDCT